MSFLQEFSAGKEIYFFVSMVLMVIFYTFFDWPEIIAIFLEINFL